MRSLKNIAAAGALVAALAPVSANANVVISSDPTQNMNCANGSCAPTHGNAVLNATDLTNLLTAGDVTIVTYFGKRKHNKDAGPIEVDAPVGWTSTSKLTLINPRTHLAINAPITVMGTGALTMSYYSLGSNGSVTFWDVNSALSINGVSFTLVDDIPTLAADIAATQGSGSYALAKDYDAAGEIFQKAPIPDFTGHFFGLGHSIDNLRIKKGYDGCEGMFSTNHGTLSYIHLRAARVTSTKQKYVGAVAGCNYGEIYYTSVDGSVSGDSTANVGGIAGANLVSRYASGTIGVAGANVVVSGGQTGGVVGENDYQVYQAYASGSVTGQSNVGGLVGANKGNLQESYSTATVNGNAGTVGGLAGFNGANIVDSYSIGAVSGTGIVGGLVGYDPNELASNAYWDLETSGISDPNQGAGLPKNDTSITGLTTAQLQLRLPYGFSKSFWALDANINNGFPYLLAIPPQ